MTAIIFFYSVESPILSCALSLFLSPQPFLMHTNLSIGMGLGPNGEPLKNVALNLPSLQSQNAGGNQNKPSNAPVPVAPPPAFPSAANVLNQSQIPNLNELAALNNVVGNLNNLNNLNPLLSTLGLGSLANSANDAANTSALDINKMVGAGSSSANSAMNNVSGQSPANYSSMGGMGSGLNQSNRMDSSHSHSMSNPFNSSFSNMSSNLSSNMNSNANSGFGNNQRNYNDMGNARNYNSQSDFGRMDSMSQNFGQSMDNGSGGNSNAGNRNMSDTILIRNVSEHFSFFSIGHKVFYQFENNKN